MQKWYAVLAILVLSLAEVQAEMHAVNPIQSARTSPSDCWGCCCNSSGSLTMNPSTIGLNSCTYQGGYCMGNARKGAWIFQIPELDAGSEITYMRFSGNRTGSWGSGYVYYKWVTSSDLNQTAISNAMSSADHWALSTGLVRGRTHSVFQKLSMRQIQAAISLWRPVSAAHPP